VKRGYHDKKFSLDSNNNFPFLIRDLEGLEVSTFNDTHNFGL